MKALEQQQEAQRHGTDAKQTKCRNSTADAVAASQVWMLSSLQTIT